jgi:hypothetical protein
VVRVDGSYSNMETVFFTGAVVAEEQQAVANGNEVSDLVSGRVRIWLAYGCRQVMPP